MKNSGWQKESKLTASSSMALARHFWLFVWALQFITIVQEEARPRKECLSEVRSQHGISQALLAVCVGTAIVQEEARPRKECLSEVRSQQGSQQVAEEPCWLRASMDNLAIAGVHK